MRNDFRHLVPGVAPTDETKEDQAPLLQKRQEAQQSGMQMNINAARDADPQRTSNAIKLANEMKVPVDFVEKNYDDLVKKQGVQGVDYQGISKDSPATATWLQNPTNARLGKRDIERLRAIESKTKRFQPPEKKSVGIHKEYGNALKGGYKHMEASLYLGMAALGNIDPDLAAAAASESAVVQAELEKQVPDSLRDIREVVAKEGGDVNKGVQKFLNTLPELKKGNYKKAMSNFIDGQTETVGQTLDLIYEMGKRPRGLSYMVTESLAASAPTLVLGSVLGAGGAAAGSVVPGVGTFAGGVAGFMGGSFIGTAAVEFGSEVQQELLNRGVDMTDQLAVAGALRNPDIIDKIRTMALKKGLTTAAIETAFSAFALRGASKALKGVPKKPGINLLPQKTVSEFSNRVGVAKQVAKTTGIESLGEGAGQAGGELAKYDGDISKVDFGGAIAEGMASVGHSFGQGVATQALAGAMVAREKFSKNSVAATDQMLDEVVKSINGLKDLDAINGAIEDVRAMDATKENPAKVQELIDLTTGGENSVYFQTDDFDDYWKRKGKSPAEEAERLIKGGGKAYTEAKNNGHNFEVPTGKFISEMAATPDNDDILEIARTSADGKTLSEANKALEELPAMMQVLAEEMTKEISADDQNTQDLKDVGKRFEDQLRAAGQKGAHAKANALVMQKAYGALGERAGMTVSEFGQMFGLQVRGPDQLQDLEAGTSVFNQTSEEADIEAVNLEANLAFEQSIEQIDEQYAQIDESEGGKIINVDLIRELSPVYAKYKAGFSAAVHEKAGPFADHLFERRLSEPMVGGVAVFSGGGGGSGKTSIAKALTDHKNPDVMLDGTFAKFDKSVRRVDKALASGRDVEIVYVYTEPREAISRAASRFERSRRWVPGEVLASDHIGSFQTIQEIADHYADNPRVNITYMDNSVRGQQPTALTLDELRQIPYNETVDGLAAFAKEQYEKVNLEGAIASDQKAAREFITRTGGAKRQGLQGSDTKTFKQSGLEKSGQVARSDLGFYSKLEGLVHQKIQGKSASVEQVQALFKEIKEDERKWTGIDEFLKGKKKVNTQELIDFLAANRLQVEEVTLTEDGLSGDGDGKAYRVWAGEDDVESVHNTLEEAEAAQAKLMEDNPERSSEEDWPIQEVDAEGEIEMSPSDGKARHGTWVLPGGENYREKLLTMPARDNGESELNRLDLDVEQQQADDDRSTKIAKDRLQDLFSLMNNDPSGFENFGTPEQFPTEDAQMQRSRAKRSISFIGEGRKFPDSFSPPQQTALDEIMQSEESSQEFKDAFMEAVLAEKKSTAQSLRRFQAEKAYREAKSARKKDVFVNDGHFPQEDILAFVRMNDRTDVDGKKVLFIEEIQSDWHQTGREQGYKGPADPELTALADKYDTVWDWEVTLGRTLKDLETDSLSFSDFESPTVSRDAFDGHVRNVYTLSKGDNKYEIYEETDGEGRVDVTLYRNGRDLKSFDSMADLKKALSGDSGEYDAAVKRISDLTTKRKNLADEFNNLRDEKGLDKKLLIGDYSRNEGSPQGAVPDAPFKKNWHEFALKRIMTMAAEGGYERVAWTTGEQQAERYQQGLLKVVNEVMHKKNEDGSYAVVGLKDGVSVEQGTFESTSLDNVARIYGKDIAKQIESGEGQESEITGYKGIAGLDLKIGGEGMKGFYDRMVKNSAKKLVKKFGADVGTTEIVVGKEGIGFQEAEASQIRRFIGNRPWSDFVKDRVEPGLGQFIVKKDGKPIPGSEWNGKNGAERDLESQLKKDPGGNFEIDRLKNPDGDRTYYKLPDSDVEVIVHAHNGSVIIHKPEFVGGPFRAKSLDRLKEILSSEDAVPKDKTETVHSIDITDKLKDAAINQGFELYQDGRGRIRFGKDRKFNIDLFKTADSSTFMHEAGHFFLEVMGDLSERDATPQEMKDDYAKILEHLGVDSRDKITVEQHELWARSWEAYLLEGKAPSASLRRSFNRFRQWLLSIYREVRNLNVELSPEIREVMGRMLATEDEIALVQDENGMHPFFEDPTAFGLTGKKAERYMKAVEEAQFAAEEQLLAKVMDDYNRKKTKHYKDTRRQVKQEVTDEINSTKLYKAISFLQQGKNPDGSLLADGVVPFKLNRKMLVDQYGAEFVKNKLPRPFIYSREDGLHHDLAAELLGFESGDAMIKQIAGALPRKQAIEAMTEARMGQEFPDILADDDRLEEEALGAIHADKRADLLRLELEHIIDNDLPTFKEFTRRTIKFPPPNKMVKAEASRVLGKTAVGKVRPNLFLAAQKRARADAAKAWGQGDRDAVYAAKMKELLNHYMYSESVKFKDKVQKDLTKFKKVWKKDSDLAKSRDINFVNAARAVLTEFGLGRGERTTEDYLRDMREYDPEGYETIKTLVDDVLTTAAPYKDLTKNEYDNFSESVVGLWDLSKSSKEITVDGKKQDMETAIDEIISQIEQATTKKERMQYDQDADKWDKTKAGLLGTKAMLRRFEHWVSAMDRGDIKGAIRKYMFTAVSEASDKYTILSSKLKNEVAAEAKKLKPRMTQTPIDSRELGFRFANKAQLMGALLHIGNTSNKSKLLVGRGWGSLNEDGSLNSKRWETFMERMYSEGVIGKPEMDFIQFVWDKFESIKPMAQKAHKQLNGYYFNEITSEEFDTPFGKYRGGYAPAQIDPTPPKQGASRALGIADKQKIDELSQMATSSYMWPAAGGNGFTKGRVTNFNKPLLLDIGMVNRHIDMVVRFSLIKPAVVDAAKVVLNPRVRQAITEIDPAIINEMIIPALNRADKQRIQTLEGTGPAYVAKWANYFRLTSSMQLMFMNVQNTVEQLTGFAPALLRVKAKYMTDAAGQFIKAPKQTADLVAEKSDNMTTRLRGNLFEYNQQMKKIFDDPTMLDDAQAFAKEHMYISQMYLQNFMDIVVWQGSYNQAIEGGATETEAIRTADRDVRETQSSIRPLDISRAESNPILRVMQMFMGFFNNLANLNVTEMRNVYYSDLGLKQKYARGFYVYLMGFAMLAIGSELVRKGLSGGDLDDDDDGYYIDDALEVLVGSQIKLLTAMVPIAGPAVQAGLNKGNDKMFDDRVSASPAITAISGLVAAPIGITKKVIDDKEIKSRDVKDVMNAMGILMGLPIGPVGKPVGYMMDVDSGKARATGPVDVVRGLVTGRAGDD